MGNINLSNINIVSNNNSNKMAPNTERAPLKLISDLNVKKPPLASHRNFGKSKIFNSSASSSSLLSN
jgi:hypothetical protein